MTPRNPIFHATQRDVVRWRNLCGAEMRGLPGWDYAGHRIEIQQLHPAYTTAGCKVALHQHSFYEAIIVLAGTAREISGSRQRLQPGNLLLNPPGVMHGWEAPDSPLVRMGIWFTISPEITIKSPGICVRNAELVTDVSDLLHSVQLKEVGWRECFSARLVLLLASVLRSAEWPVCDKPADNSSSEAHIGEMVTQFLKDNLSQPITLNDIAAHFGISVPTLTRYLRREGYAGAMTMLLELRMERAAARLTNSSEPIHSIARQVGIADPSYFCKCFGKYFGCSPQAYRNEG